MPAVRNADGTDTKVTLVSNIRGILINFKYLVRANQVIRELLRINAELTRELDAQRAVNETRDWIEISMLKQLNAARGNEQVVEKILQLIANRERTQ